MKTKYYTYNKILDLNTKSKLGSRFQDEKDGRITFYIQYISKEKDIMNCIVTLPAILFNDYLKYFPRTIEIPI